MTAADITSNFIVTMRIALLDTDPLVWREVEVPVSMTLKQLHGVVQAAMEWEDDHLWSFAVGREEISQSQATKLSLQDLLGPRKTKLLYTYDFGDCWEHELTVIRPRPAEMAGGACDRARQQPTARVDQSLADSISFLPPDISLYRPRVDTSRQAWQSGCESGLADIGRARTGSWTERSSIVGQRAHIGRVSDPAARREEGQAQGRSGPPFLLVGRRPLLERAYPLAAG